MLIAVLGLGMSGIAAMQLALSHGNDVIAFDEASQSSVNKRVGNFLDKRVRVFTDGLEGMKDLDRSELRKVKEIIISPGVDRWGDFANFFKKLSIPIISEIEFAWRYNRSKIIGVTGTNGKTTTVEMIARVLKESGVEVEIGGNYGLPFSEIVKSPHAPEWIILELSSFQLEGIESFCPDVAVWLNFAQDHLDRHKDMEEYLVAKLRIFENQSFMDYAVIPHRTESYNIETKARVITFGNEKKSTVRLIPEVGIETVNGDKIMRDQLPQIQARHSWKNVAAVVGAVSPLGIHPKTVSKALRTYNPPKYRCELVADIDGILFINDSKSTNIHSLESAIQAYDQLIILIVGGKEKGLDYSKLAHLLADRVKYVIAYGENKYTVKKAWEGSVKIDTCEQLDEAVLKAKKIAQTGDCVVFSPGTSSFDQFKNYAERGKKFSRKVLQLAKLET